MRRCLVAMLVLAPGAAAAAEPQVVFVNYSDGTTELVKGPENAARNQSSLCGVKAYPAWTGDEARTRDLQTQLAEMFADFAVVFTAQRPVEPGYTMVMVGPGADACGIFAGGIAPVLDCENRVRGNVCFDFSALGALTTIAQELGHTFGLAHTDVACDVMGSSYTDKPCLDGRWRFVDEDAAVIGGTPCAGAIQNSYREMVRILGSWPGGPHPDPMTGGRPCTDEKPPTIEVREPLEGAEVAPSFVLHASVTDDCLGPSRVRVEIPTLHLAAESSAPPWSWQLDGVPAGADLLVTLTATDGLGHTSTRELHVLVASPDDGGGCSTGGRPASLLGLLLTAAVMFTRFRRSSNRRRAACARRS